MNKAMLSSGSGNWETPRAFFAKLDEEFGFTLDVCASAANTKVPDRFFGEEIDGLVQPWAPHACWMNPPYGHGIGRWVKKAEDEAKLGATVVALLPARTDTRWFHDIVAMCSEVRFLRGRLYFSAADRAPFPSLVAIFREEKHEHRSAQNGPLWTIFERWY